MRLPKKRIASTSVRRSVFGAATLAVLVASVSKIVSAQVITEFPLLSGSPVTGIAVGSDGNMWFTDSLANQIGRISTAGIITEFSISTGQSSWPTSIAAGPDGNLWFTEYNGNQIGRITPAGSITEFPIPTAGSVPAGIAAGPDGNLWFTEVQGNKIGRITTAGLVTEFPVPTAGGPQGIAAGPDGNLWFTESLDKIGRITTTGTITEFPTTPGSAPNSIAAGPDGNLWFTENASSKIGQITTTGVVTGEFPTTTANSSPLGIAAGPDGNLWFAEYEGGQIGRMTTAGLAIGEFTVQPVNLTGPTSICAGPDGNLWFTEAGMPAYHVGKIGRITTGGLEAQVMLVDAAAVAGTSSNTNGVLETGETVQVAPAWLNSDVASAHTFTGTASDLTGPGGPTYTIDDDSADFGTVDAATPQDCDTAGGDCYLMTVSGARPGQHWDASFTESLSAGSTVHSWTLHVGESFPDVPTSQQFYAYIENLFHNGITGGCAGGDFCPDAPVTRAQMAVFLLKGQGGKNYTPPPCSETLFADEPCPGGPFVDWVNQLAKQGITGGCGGSPPNYCPTDPVRRDQMAAFLLKALHGAYYGPPACTQIFTDVPCPSQFASWIEQLAHEGITAGCGGGNYCPASSNTRGQMAVFLVKTFGLLLYGP